jgi:hypothetical protein
MMNAFIGGNGRCRWLPPSCWRRFRRRRLHPNPQAKPASMIRKRQRMKDEVSYGALRAYTRVLKAIGDASELAGRCNREKHR